MTPDTETLDALQVLIERGGLDRELTVTLRKRFLDLTEHPKTAPTPEREKA
tara:strand:+ start:1637 stop:1789 length:153 start_codon:yes stop_codon:yes gene_type:complete